MAVIFPPVFQKDLSPLAQWLGEAQEVAVLNSNLALPTITLSRCGKFPTSLPPFLSPCFPPYLSSSYHLYIYFDKAMAQ